MQRGRPKSRKGVKYKQYKLSPWSKVVKISMIIKEISIEDIANETGYSRTTLTAVINGRIISDNIKAAISDYLGIKTEYDQLPLHLV